MVLVVLAVLVVLVVLAVLVVLVVLRKYTWRKWRPSFSGRGLDCWASDGWSGAKRERTGAPSSSTRAPVVQFRRKENSPEKGM